MVAQKRFCGQQFLQRLGKEYVVRHSGGGSQSGSSGQSRPTRGRLGTVRGHQTAVIKEMVEAADIITFACDRLSLVISPKSTLCCSDVKTETLLGVDTVRRLGR